MSRRRLLLRVIAWAAGALAALTLAATATLAIAVHAVDFPVAELDPARGGPLVVTDRHGTVLRRVPAKGGRPGREAWVALDAIPSHALLAVVASEDDRFFAHGGVDPRGIVRAVWRNLAERRVGYGGSTITMQLVRMLRHPGEPRTAGRKLKEAVLALRLERALGKRAILEQYLNRAYYGRGAYGLEAAAQRYFGKPAASLSVGEATLLAIVPRSPRRYDPIDHLDRALARRDHVLGLLVARGVLGEGEVERARTQIVTPRLHPEPSLAPHFVDWVLAELPAEVRARGGVVTTTLDLPLQQALEHRVAEHVAAWSSSGLQQAGLVVLDTPTGEVRALVGSRGLASEGGHVNMAIRRRHPGSALKPFVYALAIEGGDSPASIAYDVLDVPSAYRPTRTTQPERGPVRYREALAGSYNLAAVHVLEKVGVEALATRLRLAGLGAHGSPSGYGLRLALGAARVRLVDLAAAYGFLVRGGRVVPPVAVVHVRHADGTTFRPPARAERRLFAPEVAWLVMDMLADPEARRPGFGPELPLDLPFPVAAKTGTARGFADTWAVGATREVTVAAWGGRVDGKPTFGLVAMQAAAPLVRAGLLVAGEGRALTLPPPPPGLAFAEVCPLSGKRPGPACAHRKRERFIVGTVPAASCPWHTHDEAGRVTARLPPELAAWSRRRPR